jgi:hypothetical protein
MDEYASSEIEQALANRVSDDLMARFGLRSNVTVEIEFTGWHPKDLNAALLLFGYLYDVDIPDDKKSPNQKLNFLCENVKELKRKIRPLGGAVTTDQMRMALDMMVEDGLVDDDQVDGFLADNERKTAAHHAYWAEKAAKAGGQ